MPPSPESNDDTCLVDEVSISLLDVVVRIRRLDTCGSRSDSWVQRSLIGVEAGVGITSVCGSPRPGNEVSNTLMV